MTEEYRAIVGLMARFTSKLLEHKLTMGLLAVENEAEPREGSLSYLTQEPHHVPCWLPGLIQLWHLWARLQPFIFYLRGFIPTHTCDRNKICNSLGATGALCYRSMRWCYHDTRVVSSPSPLGISASHKYWFCSFSQYCFSSVTQRPSFLLLIFWTCSS